MSYRQLENQMNSIISNLKTGEKFFLRDIIPNPPAQLGRTLYENVENGAIPNVKFIAKINNADQYEKLQIYIIKMSQDYRIDGGSGLN